MKASTVSAKGWVVIPQEMRERFGIKKGDRVHFVEYGGVIAVVPASSKPVKESGGMLKGKALVEALIASRSEEALKGK